MSNTKQLTNKEVASKCNKRLGTSREVRKPCMIASRSNSGCKLLVTSITSQRLVAHILEDGLLGYPVDLLRKIEIETKDGATLIFVRDGEYWKMEMIQ